VRPETRLLLMRKKLGLFAMSYIPTFLFNWQFSIKRERIEGTDLVFFKRN
jgi:hypothetical protein